jgi:CRP-like cAMP-binding protein
LYIQAPNELLPVNWGAADINPDIYYEAITRTVTYSLPRAEFLSAVQQNLALCRIVFALSMQTMDDYNQRIDNLEYVSAKERIINRLMYLTSRFGRRVDHQKVLIETPVTYHEVAASLNMTRETANRIMSYLMKEGIIERKGRQLVIANPQQLPSLLETEQA